MIFLESSPNINNPMMTEISLHILDIAENSTKAAATLIQIKIDINTGDDLLTISIEDNGCGMTAEETANVSDPFFTGRTTRKVGLGIPFFKSAAEMTGGHFHIQSQKNVGTKVTASFVLSHIDCLPLGDLVCTIHTLIVYHPKIEFVYHYQYNTKGFTLDTREFQRILGDIPFHTPEVSNYIYEYLAENQLATDSGNVY